MDNKLDYQILVMQASVDTNKQVTDELNQDNDELKKKLKKRESNFGYTKTLLKTLLVQNQTSSPENMD